MSVPTTLKDYWTAEIARLDAALTAARAELASVGAAEQAAAADYAQAQRDLDAARSAVDAARKALAGIPMPADGDPLLQQMRDAVLAGRVQASVCVAKDSLLRAKRERRQYLGDRIAALTARRAGAQQQSDAESKLTLQRQAWIAAAGAAPLKDVPMLADSTLSGVGAAAKAKVEADFPNNATADKDLLTRVRARRVLANRLADNASQLAAGAAAAQRSWDEASGRASDKTAGLRLAFDAAVDNLRRLVAAPALVQRSQGVLQTLAARTVSPLSAAQAKVFKADGDATLRGKREAALLLLKARDDAQNAVLDAQLAYAPALAAARVTKPDLDENALLAADAALKALHDAVTDKQNDLGSKDGALAASLDLLKTWLAAAPDAVWDPLDAMDAALDDLKAVKAMVPATLVTALSNAEAALAANLDACSTQQRQLDVLQESLAQQPAALADEREVAPRRRQAASRFIAMV